MFGRATIRLDIGPHSSFCLFIIPPEGVQCKLLILIFCRHRCVVLVLISRPRAKALVLVSSRLVRS